MAEYKKEEHRADYGEGAKSMSVSGQAGIVDTNGDPAGETDVMDLIRPGKFDIRHFHQEFEDNSDKVLIALLEQQSNSAPLKKGGEAIAYRADALIMQNRQRFSIPENNLFDILSGVISSNPDDQSYIITAREAAERLGYAQVRNAYRSLKEAARSLHDKSLIFQITLDNGKVRDIAVHWNLVLTYVDSELAEDDEEAYISFAPTPFFKALMVSSTITHGAHYNIAVSSQIQSSYARNLYYFLESRKKYKASPSAAQGEVYLSLEQLQQILGYPDSYKSSDVRRNILDKALEMNDIEGIDFNFNYKFKKMGKRVIGITFYITSAPTLKLGTKEEPDADGQSVLSILKGFGFADKESTGILKAYRENGRDLLYLTRAITKLATASNVENRTGYMIAIMKNEEILEEKSLKTTRKNGFHNFPERDNDYDEIQRQLIQNSMSDE